MKPFIIPLIALCSFIDVQAQKITRSYDNVSMSDALRDLNEQSQDYTISFMYNELEDFRVTTSIRHQSVPDALRQIIGFYPIRISEKGKGSLFVECIQKSNTRYKGHIIDEKGQPIAYANVYLLHPSDSTVIGGGVSNEAGVFVIPYEQLRISYVGYKTIYKLCSNSDLGTIRMQPNSYKLNGVEVKGSRPLVRIKDDALLTTIEGTYLSNMGTGNDVLAHIPGVIRNGNSIEVIGRGTPLIYI